MMARRRGDRRVQHPQTSEASAAATANAPEVTAPTVAGRQQRTELWLGLLVAGLIPVALLSARLSMQLWGDETFTFTLATRSVPEILTEYPAPNHHVLFTLVLSPFANLSPHEPVLRFPALLSGLATLLGVFCLGRRGGGLAVGMAAVIALGTSVSYLIFAMQLRGYGLSMAITAWLAWLAADAGARPLRWPRGLAIIVGAAALVYTIPTNVLMAAPLGMAAVGIVWLRRRAWPATVAELGVWCGGALLAAVLYAPIFSQVRAVQHQSSGGSLDRLLAVTGNFWSTALHDATLLLIVAAIGVAYAGLRWLRGPSTASATGSVKVTEASEQSTPVPVLIVLGCGLLGPFLLTPLLGAVPFMRNYTPLLPLVAVALAWGVVQTVRLVLSYFREFSVARSPLTQGLLAGALILLVYLPAVFSYPGRLAERRQADSLNQEGYWHYYAADYYPADVVRFLQESLRPGENYLLCFDQADHQNLAFYLLMADLPIYQLPGGAEQPVPATVYVVVPPRPNFAEIRDQFGIDASRPYDFPEVARFGHYRVLRSAAPIPVRVPAGFQWPGVE